MSAPLVFSVFSPEGAAHLLSNRLRGHTPGCPGCLTDECEEGARLRRALRAVRSVLKEPEPPPPAPPVCVRGEPQGRLRPAAAPAPVGQPVTQP